MIIFIDESGDTGFKTQKGSSKSFVMSLVIFDDDLDAEEAAVIIKRYRQSIHKSERFEFKFNKCNRELRTEFLKTVRSCKFRIRAMVVEKDLVYSKYLRDSKDSFYNYFLRMVLEHNGNTIKNAKIRLDGRGDQEFKKHLTTYLRRYLNSNSKKVMKNFQFCDSKENVLIQLADMVAGAIRRYYDKNTEDYNVYRKIINKHEEDIWLFK